MVGWKPFLAGSRLADPSSPIATLAVIELLDRFIEAYETAHPRDHRPGRLYSNGVLEYLLCDTCQRSYDTCDRVVCLDARGRDPASAYDAFMAQRMVQCEVEGPFLHQALRKRRTEGPPPLPLPARGNNRRSFGVVSNRRKAVPPCQCYRMEPRDLPDLLRYPL